MHQAIAGRHAPGLLEALLAMSLLGFMLCPRVNIYVRLMIYWVLASRFLINWRSTPLTTQASGRRPAWRRSRSGAGCCGRSCVTRPSRSPLFQPRLPCPTCLACLACLGLSSWSSSSSWRWSGWTSESPLPGFPAGSLHPGSSRRVLTRARMEARIRSAQCQLKQVENSVQWKSQVMLQSLELQWKSLSNSLPDISA